MQSALRFGASYLGFIVEAGGPRNLSRYDAAKLALPSKDLAQRVAVTVNADDGLIDFIARDMQADYIQFHGDEDMPRIMAIARRHQINVIKALPICDAKDMKQISEFAACDLVLLDAKPPKGASVRGGHGVSFDWDLIARSPMPKTYALAGGLNPQNVLAALAATNAPILDVSSGVEAAPGIKDERKIQAFMQAVINHG